MSIFSGWGNLLGQIYLLLVVCEGSTTWFFDTILCFENNVAQQQSKIVGAAYGGETGL